VVFTVWKNLPQISDSVSPNTGVISRMKRPLLGDEDELQKRDYCPDYYDVLQAPTGEARTWFSRVDCKRIRESTAKLVCPSCCVEIPMHVVFPHIQQCVSLRFSLQQQQPVPIKIESAATNTNTSATTNTTIKSSNISSGVGVSVVGVSIVNDTEKKCKSLFLHLPVP